MRQLLDASRLRDALTRLTGWTGDTRGITRTMRLTDGAHAALLERLKVCADALGHRPYVERRDGVTRVDLVDPAVGSVTERDVTLAARIDGIVRATAGPA